MKLDRRDFLRLAARAGLVLPASHFLTTTSQAQASPYTGKIFINIIAGGGLDQSSWTDPRETDRSINTWVGTPAIVAGNIRAAPMGNNKSFFEKYYRQMLVINGINSLNANHGEGLRVQATGVDGPGMPSVTELFAYNHGRSLPLPWLNMEYPFSAGLQGPATFPPMSTLRAMAQPNRVPNTTTPTYYMKTNDVQKIQEARTQRLQTQQLPGTLVPRIGKTNEHFLAAGSSRALLSRVADFIPATTDTRFAVMHTALVAAQAGIVATLQLSVGAFDAHTRHDEFHNRDLPALTDLVDFTWQKAAELGIQNRVFLRIFTEFGRTGLNNNGGKDHWAPGGTTILMEANPVWGNRVVGATSATHRSLKINPTTLAVDPVNGVVILPMHVLDALRRYLGAGSTDPRFDLKVPATQRFDFFNPALSTGYPYA